MKIKFNYDVENPEDVAEVLGVFYDFWKNKTGTDGYLVKFGKINLYITLKNETNNIPLQYLDKNNKEIFWEVTQSECENTKKNLLYKNNDLVIYDSSPKPKVKTQCFQFPITDCV